MLVFEMAGEIGLLLVIQTGGNFFDGGTSAQQGEGVQLPLFCQPDLGTFGQVLEKVPVQRARGYPAELGQFGGRPVGL